MSHFITQGNRWPSSGPVSPRIIMERIIDKMERAAFVQKDRNAFDIAKDELAVFAGAHLSAGKSDLWRQYGLTRQLGCIADLLHSKMGRVVSRDEIMNALYFDRPDGGPGPKIIDVRICKLRGLLRDSPFAIETQNCFGYRMVKKQEAVAA